MNPIRWPSLDEALPLTNNLVIVVRFGLEADVESVGLCRSVLSADELIRADRYKFDEPRRRFVVCRATVRHILAAVTGREAAAIEFIYGQQGKPFLKGCDESCTDNREPDRLDFSLSHTGDLAMLALARGRRIGLDVEQHDPNIRAMKLARRFFSEPEARQLGELPESEVLAGFYRGWTSKEAYLKATGLG